MNKWYIVYQGREGNPMSTVGPFDTKLDAETYLGVVSNRAKILAPGVYYHQERRGAIGKKGQLMKAGMTWAFQVDGRIEMAQ